MADAETIQCARCEAEGVEPLGAPPFRDELGRRVAGDVCSDCWEDWKERQMLLINHFNLSLREPEARDFLRKEMLAFLFSEGEETRIDTSLEGEIDW